ncbi:MAG: diguanylate cyclase [Desulfobacterales bacterium]|nr:diguanylate cyclase [Desulfobacterales bacterium]
MFLVAVFAAFSLAPGWRALGGGVPIAAVLVAALLLACILLGRRLKHSLALNNDLAAQAADLAQSNTLFKVELDEHRQVETALRRQKNHLEIQLKAGTCELQRAEADQRQTADILNEYQMALEASDDMVAVLDRTYTYRMANKAFLEQRRTDRAAVIGRTVADVMGDDAFHALRPHLDACFQGDSVEYEMVPENAGLGNRQMLVRYYPVRASAGRVDRVVSVIKNITALKQAEAERERVFSISLDPICIVGFDGYFKDLNTAWSEILGWSREELLSIPWISFVHPDDADEAMASAEKLMQGQTLRDFRNRYVCKDGRIRWLEWNAMPAEKEGRIYAVARDVTDQIEAQERIRLNEERLDSLLKLSQMSGVSDEKIREYALEEIVRLTRSKAGYLHLFNEDTGSLELVSWSKGVLQECRAEKMRHYPLAQAGVWADSIRLRRPVVHNDFANLPNRKGMPEGHFAIRRHMSVPVLDDGRIVAVAGVGNKAEPYDESDINQLSLFMQSMWSILKEKRARHILRKYSMEDGLTGLANRRRLDEVLACEWQRAKREQQSLALIILDIDHFKAFNDFYGHQAGDDCLRKVATRLRANIRRAGDLIARYGGEEFAVVLPNTDGRGAAEVAEAMRRSVMELNLRHKGAPRTRQVTVSAGVAMAVPGQGAETNIARLIESADKALYRAKGDGRNKVCGPDRAAAVEDRVRPYGAPGVGAAAACGNDEMRVGG